MALMVWEYVAAENGTVHLARQADLASPDAKTLCGRRVAGWATGDETVSGLQATCLVCRRCVT